ncbi:MAG TPA: phosphatidate cytidylyltransferase [Ignavibacteria bacterium]|nr:phosphatidate cytidylyltransferase [Ignavibacteria bacterium]
MSNTLKRVIVGLIAIPVLILIILNGGIYFLIFSLLICAFAMWELFSIFVNKNFFPLKYISIFLSLLITILFYFEISNFYYLILLYIPIITTAEIFRKDNASPVNILISLFGFFYISLPILLMNYIINLEIFNYVLYSIILVWTCDTFAYFGGKKFGKHKLSVISPNKTIEGSAIGFIFTLIFSFLFHFIFPTQISLTDAIVMGLLVGFFAQIGDLFESLLKRYTGVKDSSELIPGHGGVLDRFDSLLFVTPIVFVYIVFFKNLF